MSRPEETNWEYFGFPDPGFMPAWLPAEGLMKALAERNLPFANEWDFEKIAVEDQLKPFLTSGSGQVWCREFDRQLKQTAERYLNHLKMSDLSDLPDWSEAMWTWDELLLEAADGERENIADPKQGDLSPEWDLNWLLQRRKAIDLLLYAPVPYKADILSGSTHTGIPSSPGESIAAAMEGMSPRTVVNQRPAAYITNIYGPDHGWREGSYCCDVTAVSRIYAELPEGLGSPDHIYLVMQVSGADGTDDSFSGGGPLSIGANVLTADPDGVFAEFDWHDLSWSIPAPTRDHTTSGGWKATRCSAFADYSEHFNFKNQEKES